MAGQSLLLTIPRELRNKLYEYMAVDESKLRIKTSPTNECPLASSCKLIIVCKQINAEYSETLLATALNPTNDLTIQTTILDDDFGNLIRFISALKPTYLGLAKAGFKIYVKLVKSPGWDRSQCHAIARTQQWAEFCETAGLCGHYDLKEAIPVGPAELRIPLCEGLIQQSCGSAVEKKMARAMIDAEFVQCFEGDTLDRRGGGEAVAVGFFGGTPVKVGPA